MTDVQDQRELFLLFCLVLMVAAPVLSWLVLPNRTERAARLWFGGAALLGLTAVIFYFQRSGNSTLLLVVNVAVGLMALDAIGLELQPHRDIRWRRIVGPIAAAALIHEMLLWAMNQQIISQAGLLAPRLTLLVTLEWWLVARALRLASVRRSRGMVLIAIGTGLLGLTNTGRLAAVLLGAQGMGAEVDSRVLPVLGSVLTLTSLTYSFGFVSYALERTWQRAAESTAELAHAEAREALAQSHSQELRQLVEQRDAMLMTSSRLSAIRAMGLYNAAIVHEISQPLQALRSTLDRLELLHTGGAARDPSADPRSFELIRAAQDLTGKASGVIQSLRRLMAARPADPQTVHLNACVHEILSILKGEAQRRGVIFDCVLDPRLDKQPVRAEALLFQRLVMNLVGNSLDAVMSSASHPRIVQLLCEQVVHQDQLWARLVVRDSGPGFPESVLTGDSSDFMTQKHGGMGVGLTLCRILASAWQGELRLDRASWPDGAHASTGRGAQVEFLLPLV